MLTIQQYYDNIGRLCKEYVNALQGQLRTFAVTQKCSPSCKHVWTIHTSMPQMLLAAMDHQHEQLSVVTALAYLIN